MKNGFRMIELTTFHCFLQNPVGPGRFNLHRYDDAQHVNDHGSAFNSKTRRCDLARDKYMM